MSKVEQLFQDLKKDLNNGEFGPKDTVFITVRELAARYSVSLVTAHKVMTALKEAGLLIGNSTNAARIGGIAVGRGSDNRILIGLVVTNIASPFFSALCRHIQEAGSEYGCQILTESSGYDDRRERDIIDSFLAFGVAGLLICPGLSRESVRLYTRLNNQNRKMVFLGRNPGTLDVNVVAANNALGGAFMADHFVAQKYETVGYIGFGSRLPRDHRMRGFRSRLREWGIELANENVCDGNGGDIEHGYRATEHLLARTGKPPRALFAFNDLLAIGAMRGLRDNGFDVPGNVAVAGFDDLPESRVTSPALTTIGYPIRSMASIAVHAVLDLIKDPRAKKPDRILLEPELIVRASTDPRAKPVLRSSRVRMESYAPG